MAEIIDHIIVFFQDLLGFFVKFFFVFILFIIFLSKNVASIVLLFVKIFRACFFIFLGFLSKIFIFVLSCIRIL